MLKKTLCGALVAAALSAPLAAEELYVRNRAFGDAAFVGGTTYVPVTSFLKALDVPWTVQGRTVVLGSGDSPEATFDGDAITVTHQGKSLDLSGIMRGGKLYVPAKELANLAGFTVIHNPTTGIVDVVKSRDYSAADVAAAKEVESAQQATRDALKAEREARRAKEKAAAEAKAKAKAEAEGEESEADETSTETGETAGTNAPAEASAASTAASAPEAASAEPQTPKEPPKANLVVLTNDAEPNLYTGEVVFRAVLQNQGFAPAEGISAVLTCTGPDNRVWLKKTLYRGPLAVDARWEITETYKHPLGGAAPRGSFKVDVAPNYKSAVVPETQQKGTP